MNFLRIFGENGRRRWTSIAPSLLPENVLPQWQQKIADAENKARSFHDPHGDRMDFSHKVRFSAGIGPAHFPAAFGMLLNQHSKEGAPFMGTALAEYRQCIGAEVVCHFHLPLIIRVFFITRIATNYPRIFHELIHIISFFSLQIQRIYQIILFSQIESGKSAQSVALIE